MKYECNVIRDLMPLCADGIAAEESKAAVQAHIAECAACAAEWAEVQQGGAVYPETAVPAETKRYAQTAKRVRRGRRRTVIAAVCVTLVLAAVGVCKGLHSVGARFTPEASALFDVRCDTSIPEERLSVVGSYEANMAKQIVFVMSNDTENEYGAREFWCTENVQLAAFLGLWTGNGATMRPLDDRTMQHDISVPFHVYGDYVRQAYVVWCGNPDVKRIALQFSDSSTEYVKAEVNENGLCILDAVYPDLGKVVSGYAEDERGYKIYTLKVDEQTERWEAAE